MNLKSSRTITFGILVSILVCITIQPPAQAVLLQSNWLNGSPPTIDGFPTVAEWENSYNNSIPCYLSGNPSTKILITFKALNDANNLYLLIQWTDATHNSDTDGFILLFDENNDNNIYSPINSENAVEFDVSTVLSEFHDGYGDSNELIHYDLNKVDGEANATWISSQYNLEMRIPLNANDTEDLQVGPGDMIGIAIVIVDGLSNYYEFPFDSAMSLNHYSNPFQLAANSSSIGSPSIFLTLAILGLIAIFAIRRRYDSIIPSS